MIYFSFTDQGAQAPVMSVLDAVEPDAALAEALERLRTAPGASEAHVFNGDLFVGTVEAPAFGFAGVNKTTALDGPAEAPHPGGNPAMSKSEPRRQCVWIGVLEVWSKAFPRPQGRGRYEPRWAGAGVDCKVRGAIDGPLFSTVSSH